MVNVEPDIVEQSVDDLRRGALEAPNSDFSNGLDVFFDALILHKACVILRPTIVHFFFIKIDSAPRDALRARWNGFRLVGQHHEWFAVYGQQ